ncbi:MAG TPA: di-heme oxidoredictase family protein [Bryobacteraceae bacterium]|nr:di-heme oxidoredictase family protein [Bryobacteraceae bacterium]
MEKTIKSIGGIGLLLAALTGTGQSQATKAHDPGPRAGVSAGGPIDNLTPGELKLFNDGQAVFGKTDTVAGDGLGPRMNLDSCAGCHAQPAVGGTGTKPNPQSQIIKRLGLKNTLPFFITPDGPTREARFQRTSTGALDGGVHNLFTIVGAAGAGGCQLTQPDFEANKKNEIFRIPTPVFGAGLIEQIRDTDILANLASEAPAKQRLKIKGRLNIVVSGNTRTEQTRIQGVTNNNGNDGTIARFGWKAQNKSLLLFAGEAYNVEMGITNELFQTEREEACPNAAVLMPNDGTNTNPNQIGTPNPPFDVLSDIEHFAAFMRFLAPPKPSDAVPGGSASISKGKALFSRVGCHLCHTPALTTDPNSRVAALSGKTANLYSDLALHQMGKNLEDGISQGEAVGDEFRTAPLWGVGQRLFFLHDGRTTDLLVAIQEHRGIKSEANGVIGQFDRLSESDKQNVLNFLRSL